MVEPAAPSAIAVRVRLFASYREAAGLSRDEVSLPSGSRVSDLTAALRERYPRFAPSGGLVAVNHEYVGESFGLHDGDEVAFIPPVSGGAPTPSPRREGGSEGSPGLPGPCSA